MIQEVETKYGTVFIPETDVGQYWWLRNTGASPEDQYIQPICELLAERPRGCAVDVGANFGCWTLPLSKVAHTVVAIEPQACVHRMLGQTLMANNIRNVDLHRLVAGDRMGMVQIAALDELQDFNFGGVEVGQTYNGSTLEAVHMTTLDTLLIGNMVSFIKMDVEGYEVKVIEGAKWTLERCKPIIFAEKDHPRTNQDYLKGLLVDAGYAVEVWGGNFVGFPI